MILSKLVCEARSALRVNPGLKPRAVLSDHFMVKNCVDKLRFYHPTNKPNPKP
jgi:hypothetical protein